MLIQPSHDHILTVGWRFDRSFDIQFLIISTLDNNVHFPVTLSGLFLLANLTHYEYLSCCWTLAKYFPESILLNRGELQVSKWLPLFTGILIIAQYLFIHSSNNFTIGLTCRQVRGSFQRFQMGRKWAG